jgi:hypothetical protein
VSRMLRLPGPYVALPELGAYRFMSAEGVWLALMGRIAVSGSARGIEKLTGDTENYENFKAALSLAMLRKQRHTQAYLANILRHFSATRFHNTGASLDEGAHRNGGIQVEERSGSVQWPLSQA